MVMAGATLLASTASTASETTTAGVTGSAGMEAGLDLRTTRLRVLACLDDDLEDVDGAFLFLVVEDEADVDDLGVVYLAAAEALSLGRLTDLEAGVDAGGLV